MSSPSFSRVTEFLPPTATDLELLDLARREGAVLITADLDFSALIATSREMSPSLVSLRLAFPTPPGPPTARRLVRLIRWEGACRLHRSPRGGAAR